MNIVSVNQVWNYFYLTEAETGNQMQIHIDNIRYIYQPTGKTLSLEEADSQEKSVTVHLKDKSEVVSYWDCDTVRSEKSLMVVSKYYINYIPLKNILYIEETGANICYQRVNKVWK